MSHDDIPALEAELTNDPDSYGIRERLVFAYAENRRTYADPRRIEHIRWFIRHHPGANACQTPLVHVDPDDQPDAYAALKDEWLRALADQPTDAGVVRAVANFIALSDGEHGRQILRAAIERDPDNGSLHVELGRLSPEPAARLAHFQNGLALAAPDAPNLLVWIARTATEAADYITAEKTAFELIASMDAMRAKFGDKLDWPDDGEALWARARNATPSNKSAWELVDAISEHGYRKHWAHTVLGLVAHARCDVEAAARHLHESARVPPDFRLTSYGPSIELARALCLEGRWSDAQSYFERWQEMWDDQRARDWRDQVSRHQLPEPSG